MRRALTEHEKLRYPWASCIVDYVPVGRTAKVALGAAWGGLGVLLLGVLVIYVFTSKLHTSDGLPTGPLEWGVYAAAWLGIGVGCLLGSLGAVRAVLRSARVLLVWSLGAVVPAVIWLVIWLVAR